MTKRKLKRIVNTIIPKKQKIERESMSWQQLPWSVREKIINFLCNLCPCTIMNLYTLDKAHQMWLKSNMIYRVSFVNIMHEYWLRKIDADFRAWNKFWQSLINSESRQINIQGILSYRFYMHNLQLWLYNWYDHLYKLDSTKNDTIQDFLQQYFPLELQNASNRWVYSKYNHLDAIISALTQCSIENFNHTFVQVLTGNLLNHWHPFAINWIKSDSIELLQILLERGMDPNTSICTSFSRELQPLLIVAAYYGAFNIVKTLLEAGANVNIMDNKGYTPLYHILFLRSKALKKELPCYEYYMTFDTPGLAEVLRLKKIKYIPQFAESLGLPKNINEFKVLMKVKEIAKNILNCRDTIFTLLKHPECDITILKETERLAISYPQSVINQMRDYVVF